MYRKRNEPVVCADGFTMSVQASQFNYCRPQDDFGPYTEAEIGFPNAPEEMIMSWAEDPDDPTNTVYGYVPRDTILAVIAKHGGMVDGELPKGIPNLWTRS